jgi:glycosyltransferase involved in cell wall biosynthesis
MSIEPATKVLFVILGRYPTEKAYGVTTKNTLEALKALGIKTYCVSYPDFNAIDLPEGFYSFKEGRIARFLRYQSYKSFGYFGKACWKITTHLALRQVSELIQTHSPSVLWIRDSRILKRLPRYSSSLKVILEIHETATTSLVSAIRKLGENKVILAPISQIIFDQLKVLTDGKYQVILSPMGINPAKFSEIRGIKDFRLISKKNPIVIGYFGKLSPNGYSKGVEDILDLVRLHTKINFPSKIQLVGLNSIEIKAISKSLQDSGVSEDRYNLELHKLHDDAIRAMSSCDILFLPKQRNNSYVGSPIKGIEYAATGLPILAARSNANLSLFHGSIHVFWYEAEDIDSMHQAVISIIESTNLEKFSAESRKFAFSRSWLARSDRLLQAALKL